MAFQAPPPISEGLMQDGSLDLSSSRDGRSERARSETLPVKAGCNQIRVTEAPLALLRRASEIQLAQAEAHLEKYLQDRVVGALKTTMPATERKATTTRSQ